MNILDYGKALERLDAYMSGDKNRVIALERIHDIHRAYEAAQTIFHGAEIKIKMDLLKIDALSLCIKAFDIDINDDETILSFAALIKKADHFRISSTKEGGLCLSLTYRCVNTYANK